MMRYKVSLIILLALSLAMLLSACSVPGGTSITSGDNDGTETKSDLLKTKNETVSDSMTATIDGSQYSFELDSAAIKHGNIEVSYSAYNPRGERMYNVKLYFDKNIAPGSYSTRNGDTVFRVQCGLLSVNSGSAMVDAAGSYELELTSRDSDWRIYQGTFSAELGRNNLSGTYGAQSMSISNASFHFTIT